MKQVRRYFGLILLITGCAHAAANLPPPVGPEAQAGFPLYQAKCALCHEIVAPQDFSKAQWPTLLDKYGKRARLKPEDHARILAYLEEAGR